MLIIDGHCDSILDFHHGRRSFYGSPNLPTNQSTNPPSTEDHEAQSNQGHVDYPRLRQAGVGVQFFALFTSDEYVHRSYDYTQELLDTFDQLVTPDKPMKKVLNSSQILECYNSQTLGGLLTIEGGEPIGDSLERLREFYHRGVRLMTLTWNRQNAIARGVRAQGSEGLTAFGRQVVREMETLGMIVDCSHLSDQALDDLLDLCSKPIVASHSNSRELLGHPRNLTDQQLKQIAQTGGLVGLTFAGVFVDSDPKKVTLDRALDHLERLINQAGIDHVGLGSDFDGFTAPYGLVMADCTGLPGIAQGLRDRGYGEADVEKVMGLNWLRVVQQVLG